MRDDLASAVEAKDVNASSFLAGPIQIAHVYEGKISVDGNTIGSALIKNLVVYNVDRVLITSCMLVARGAARAISR